MPKPSIVRMGLALLLLDGVVPVVLGYIYLREWAAEGTALVICGAIFLLSGLTMIASALRLLVSLGRERLPLLTGGIASILSAGVLVGASLAHVMPCAGPA